NLPLRAACADAVFAYESFHHIPDRIRAMAGYDRVLSKGGRVVLAEPDEKHERSDVAVDAMTKYGILERGMSLAHGRKYVAGTTLTRVEQMFVPAMRGADIDRTASRRFLRKRRLVDGNLFVIRRPVPLRERIADVVEHRDQYWIKLKHRVKMAMLGR